MVSLTHKVDHLYPLLQCNLQHYTVTKPIESWALGVLGESAGLIEEWVEVFGDQQYRQRAAVDAAVRDYCEAEKESKRYGPLCAILNGIIDFVHSKDNSFPNLPPLPLEFIRFCPNDPNVILRDDNTMDAQRKPDVLTLSPSIYDKYHSIHMKERSRMEQREGLQSLVNMSTVRLKNLKQSKKGQCGIEADRLAEEIKHCQDELNTHKKEFAAITTALYDHRTAHRISTQNNHHTSQDPGPMTQGIDWCEPLGPVEVNDKPRHVRIAAYNLKWKACISLPIPGPRSAQAPARPRHTDTDIVIKEPSSLQLIGDSRPSREENVAGMKRKGMHAPHSDMPPYARSRPTKQLRTDSSTASSTTQTTNPAKGEEQLASYAIKLLARTRGIRSHCIGILFDSDEVQFWYYDASGMIKSGYLNWFTEFETFAAVIVALGCLDLARWGIGDIPRLTRPSSLDPNCIPHSLNGYTLTMKHVKHENVMVMLGKPIFSQYSLVGRRTLVYNITTNPPISDRDLVLKMSWQVCTRLSEAHILNTAKEKDVEHLPELHMWTDGANEYRLSQGIRGQLFPDNKLSNGEEAYEDRCLRFMVFTKYENITKIISPANLDYVFLQLIGCLEKLRAALIVHRDLSITNLMHGPQRCVGDKPYVILNDFDLATFVNPDGSLTAEKSAKHRTGTLPFMACDILGDPEKPHYLRHDLESALYIVFWIAVNYPLGSNKERKEKREIFQYWEEGTLQEVYDAKTRFIKEHEEVLKVIDQLSPDFAPYEGWLLALWEVFQAGLQAKAKSRQAQEFKGCRIMRLNKRKEGQSSTQLPQAQVSNEGDETLYDTVTPSTMRVALSKERDELRQFVEDLVEDLDTMAAQQSAEEIHGTMA